MYFEKETLETSHIFPFLKFHRKTNNRSGFESVDICKVVKNFNCGKVVEQHPKKMHKKTHTHMQMSHDVCGHTVHTESEPPESLHRMFEVSSVSQGKATGIWH